MAVIVRENVPLAPYHTFGLQASARYFVEIAEEDDIAEVIKLPFMPKLILGGGSNVLFTGDFSGLIIKNTILGIKRIGEDDRQVTLEIGGGVIWHDLVLWAVGNNYGGLENLSLIPGTVGAAPIQNIGAYGVEFDSVFDRLDAINLSTGEKEVFDKEACKFGYRNSIFKHKLKGRFFITRVQVRLTRKGHRLSLDYGDIRNTLEKKGITHPKIKDVSEAVITIRSSKLPDPGLIGNAGSFFKNPVIGETAYEDLLQVYPDMPGFPAGAGKRKVPAAWLIEQAGWKGFRQGDAGVYPKHALVLVNYGQARGAEIQHLSEAIRASVREIFQIELEPEVNLI